MNGKNAKNGRGVETLLYGYATQEIKQMLHYLPFSTMNDYGGNKFC